MSKIRAGGILIEDNKLLLIHRIKNNNEFYVFPGGTVENNETVEEALIREFKEECSLEVEIKSYAIDHLSTFSGTNNIEKYFFLNRISGEPKLDLSSPEMLRMLESNNENFYELVWITIEDLKNYLIYPKEIKNFVIDSAN